MMKKTLLLLALGVGALSMSAAVVEPYQYDFNSNIDTSRPNFKVGSNWGHIVGSVGSSPDEYYMTYTWKETGDQDGTGCLSVSQQYAKGPYSYSDKGDVYDYLVTPPIKGEVTVDAKPTMRNNNYIEVHKIAEDGSLGEQIKKITITDAVSYNNWGTVTLLTAEDTGDSYESYALRCSYVDLDNFKAGSADISPEAGLTFEAIEPSATTGTIYCNQQADGSVKISFTVSVTNNGQVDLHTGDENYTITVYNAENKTDIFTVPVPVDLAVGETSAEFEVTGYVAREDIPNVWASTYITHKLGLRENCSKNSRVMCYYGYKVYEPKFIMRKAGSSSSYNETTPVAYGLVNAETDAAALTTAFEIFNDGAAPLTIVSMTLPEGFSGLPEPSANFTIEPGAKVEFSVTLPAATVAPGSYAGELEVKYLDKDQSELRYALAVSGTVTAPGAWTCDFGTSSNRFPAGSFADSGISTDYSYSSTSNYYLKGASYNGNFVLPKLHIVPGDELIFETKLVNSNGYVKVYVSTDRYNWGEPVKTFDSNDISSSSFQLKTVGFDDMEEGDYYVMMEMPNCYIDNICGPTLAANVYDIYIKPDDSSITKQSGQEVSFTVKAVGVVALQATDYTMEYRTDDEVLCAIESKAITADAKKENSFPVKFTPVVEQTTTYQGYIQVTFVDGTVVKSPVKPVTVTYRGDFVFNTPTISDSQWSKPSSLSGSSAIDFGVSNELGQSKEYEIFNWGGAPLQILSISVPEGFTVTPESAVMASKEHLPVTITLSATEAGSYEGNLVIAYTEDAAEGEQTYQLAIKATLLDPEKWYAPFLTSPTSTSTMIWPAGTIHGKNLSGSNLGSYSTPVWGVNSTSTTDNMIVSPKLHAGEGDKLDINAKLYSSSWGEGCVRVYTAATREGLEDAATRTQVAVLSGNAEDLTHTVTTDWTVCQIEMPAGDYYVGFEFTDRLYVNYFYGLKPVEVAHDLKIQSSSVPTTVMQNTLSNYSVGLLNFARVAEAAGGYTVAAYVDGEKVAETVGDAEIPVALMYTDPTTTVTMPVRIPKVGTSSVYLTVTAGEQTLSTEPVEVTVTPEVLSAEKQVGEISTTDLDDAPVFFYDKNSQTVMLYTPDQLGLNDGDAINAMTFAGSLVSSNLTRSLSIHYAWVDNATLDRPANGKIDTSEMAEAMAEENYVWPNGGTTADYISMVQVNFDTPTVYNQGKSLLLVVTSENGSTFISKGNYSWVGTSVRNQCYKISHDTYSTYSTQSWSAVNLPVLFLGLDVTPVSVSGIVTDGDEAAADAEVTFVSADGDNVQYAATTDENGAYSVDLIQSSRTYNIYVAKAGKEDFLLEQTFGESNDAVNFALMEVVEIDNVSGNGHQASANALVKLNLTLEEGYNAIVLPFDLNADEVAEVFGDAELLGYDGSRSQGDGNILLCFSHAYDITAGQPYLVNLTAAPAPVVLRGKAVTTELSHSLDTHNHADFCGTYEAKAMTEGMYTLSSGNFVEVSPALRGVEAVSPYSAYVQAKHDISGVSFTIDDDHTLTGIETIEADQLGEDDVIYTISGIRVTKPVHGVYIVNGVKKLVK